MSVRKTAVQHLATAKSAVRQPATTATLATRFQEGPVLKFPVGVNAAYALIQIDVEVALLDT